MPILPTKHINFFKDGKYFCSACHKYYSKEKFYKSFITRKFRSCKTCHHISCRRNLNAKPKIEKLRLSLYKKIHLLHGADYARGVTVEGKYSSNYEENT